MRRHFILQQFLNTFTIPHISQFKQFLHRFHIDIHNDIHMAETSHRIMTCRAAIMIVTGADPVSGTPQP
jgi:hypothetical protein